eukprot:6476123-Amphidinium_carterae.1
MSLVPGSLVSARLSVGYCDLLFASSSLGTMTRFKGRLISSGFSTFCSSTFFVPDASFAPDLDGLAFRSSPVPGPAIRLRACAVAAPSDLLLSPAAPGTPRSLSLPPETSPLVEACFHALEPRNPLEDPRLVQQIPTPFVVPYLLPVEVTTALGSSLTSLSKPLLSSPHPAHATFCNAGRRVRAPLELGNLLWHKGGAMETPFQPPLPASTICAPNLNSPQGKQSRRTHHDFRSIHEEQSASHKENPSLDHQRLPQPAPALVPKTRIEARLHSVGLLAMRLM